MNKDKLLPGHQKKGGCARWPLLSWLFLLGLVAANVATFLAFWTMLSSPGLASGLFGTENNSALVNLALPLPTSASEPTPTATRVAVYLPTPTSTTTPTPTSIPSPTATTPPPAPAPAIAAPAALPPPKIEHVIIISIDGLRPDALDLAYTPTLDDLRAKGAYSPRAQTVSLSITLPSHASMLTGMPPDKHGIVWGLPYIGWPGMNGPTLFNVAHDAGLSTAMVFGKDKMNYLVLPGSVDRLFGEDASDPEVSQEALAIVEAGLPHLLFVHYPDTDRIGHKYGWMSENQFGAITFVDGLIGELVAALEAGDYLNRTLLIITADHGGHGFNHGDDSPEDRTIPWLAVGPGVSQDVILSSSINTMDTAATAAHALTLPSPEIWEGQPVLEIFE